MSGIKKDILRRAWAEIHTDRLKRNVEKLRALLPEGVEPVCVVKANAYGHGVENTVSCLEEDCGINWFAVSTLNEAIELRDLGVAGEILILGYTPPKNAPEIIEYDIIQTVTDREYAEELSKQCPASEKIRCHIAYDTGMTRIGLRGDVSFLGDETEKIVKLPSIEVEGIFTHLSVADSAEPSDAEYTKNQIEELVKIKNELNRRMIVVQHMHFLNSAGAAYHPDPRGDLARLGILLYGLKPDGGRELPIDLEPVMDLKATVAQIKTVPAGVDVSYGRTFTTARDTEIAVVTIGYADGYPRALSGKSEVLINGKRAPVIGRICMDQLMADISGIPGVKPGDAVTLIGRDGDETITADGLAALAGTIGYEIVCGISPRVPRTVI